MCASSLGDSQIHLTANGQDFSEDSVGFEYVSSLHITNLLPLKGPASGGTRLVIRGENFFPRGEVLGLITCKFEQNLPIFVKAAKLSSTDEVT